MMVESTACSLSAGGPRLARVSNAASHTPSLPQMCYQVRIRTKSGFAGL
jgi:NAD kinase